MGQQQRTENRKKEIMDELNNNPHTAKELATKLGVTTGTIHTYLRQLYSEGRVNRKYDSRARDKTINERRCNIWRVKQ